MYDGQSWFVDANLRGRKILRFVLHKTTIDADVGVLRTLTIPGGARGAQMARRKTPPVVVTVTGQLPKVPAARVVAPRTAAAAPAAAVAGVPGSGEDGPADVMAGVEGAYLRAIADEDHAIEKEPVQKPERVLKREEQRLLE